MKITSDNFFLIYLFLLFCILGFIVWSAKIEEEAAFGLTEVIMRVSGMILVGLFFGFSHFETLMQSEDKKAAKEAFNWFILSIGVFFGTLLMSVGYYIFTLHYYFCLMIMAFLISITATVMFLANLHSALVSTFEKKFKDKIETL